MFQTWQNFLNPTKQQAYIDFSRIYFKLELQE